MLFSIANQLPFNPNVKPSNELMNLTILSSNLLYNSIKPLKIPDPFKEFHYIFLFFPIGHFDFKWQSTKLLQCQKTNKRVCLSSKSCLKQNQRTIQLFVNNKATLHRQVMIRSLKSHFMICCKQQPSHSSKTKCV